MCCDTISLYFLKYNDVKKKRVEMKKLVSLLLTVVFMFSVAGCGSNAQSSSSAVSESSGSQSVSSQSTETAEDLQTSYPVTVTDQAGREVTIEKEPEKVVSGYYISTSLLIALGQESKIVGIEAKADKRPIYKLSAPELIELPNVGSAKQFDLEGCAALEPDLVILPLKLSDAADTLTDLGIDVLLVNPENQELSDEMRDIVSVAMNCQDKAEELSAFVAAQEEFLSKATENSEKPTVYLAGNSSFLSTAGSQMYQNSLITMAGGENVAAEISDTYWAEVSYEQVLAWNPDYIIIAAEADYTVDDVLNDPNIADLQAVKDKKVYQMPNSAEAWDSPVPGGILGAVWLSGILCEDVTSETVNSIIGEFYDTFYGFTYQE